MTWSFQYVTHLSVLETCHRDDNNPVSYSNASSCGRIDVWHAMFSSDLAGVGWLAPLLMLYNRQIILHHVASVLRRIVRQSEVSKRLNLPYSGENSRREDTKNSCWDNSKTKRFTEPSGVRFHRNSFLINSKSKTLILF